LVAEAMSGVASVTLIGGENIRDELIIEQRIQRKSKEAKPNSHRIQVFNTKLVIRACISWKILYQ
jgi:hypothetical protein